LPGIPGREVAGVVDGVGPDVADAWLGRRVVAHLGMVSGGYAELAVTDVGRLHVLPDGMAADVAVAMIGTGRTTMAILDVAQLTPDDVVLVTAAAGGIGSLLLQAARGAGATVIGVAGGPLKVAQVGVSGAAAAIDYTQPRWPAAVRNALAGRDLSVALDGVGGATGRQALELLGDGGRLILFGWSSGEPTPLSAMDLYAHGLTVSAAIGPRIQKWPGGLRGLEEAALAMAATGRLVPPITSFSLADAAAAHTALETRATTGKTVLVP
jgi:NADPH2:quinone reductase